MKPPRFCKYRLACRWSKVVSVTILSEKWSEFFLICGNDKNIWRFYNDFYVILLSYCSIKISYKDSIFFKSWKEVWAVLKSWNTDPLKLERFFWLNSSVNEIINYIIMISRPFFEWPFVQGRDSSSLSLAKCVLVYKFFYVNVLTNLRS